MTLKEAKELAIMKWEFIVENDGDLDSIICEVIPELSGLQNLCSYCELFLAKDCQGCPLAVGCMCMEIEHPYSVWLHNSTTENAQKVLDLIKSIEV